MTRALLVAALLAACSKGSGEQTSAPPNPRAPVPPPTAAAPPPAPAPAPAPDPDPPPAPPAPDEVDDHELREPVQITLMTGGGSGVGEMRDRGPGGDLGKQITAVGSGGPRGNPDAGPSAPPAPAAGKPTLRLVVDGSFDIPEHRRLVEKELKAKYTFGLIRCAQAQDFTGAMRATFVIDERGRTTDILVADAGDAMAECVRTYISRWRMTRFTDEDGEPIELDVKLTLRFDSPTGG